MMHIIPQVMSLIHVPAASLCARLASSLAGQITSLNVRSYASANAALVKSLREKSGAPISDVKNCLIEANWDAEQAYELLRKKGLAAAAKKSSRHAAQGLIGCATAPGVATLVEINSETDFVARNELFGSLVNSVAQAVLQLQSASVDRQFQVDPDQLAACRTASGATVTEACAEVAAQVRENIKVRRAFRVTSSGVLCTYLHQTTGPGLARIASLVVVDKADGSPIAEPASKDIAEVGHQLAMHVAGLKPMYLDRVSVPAAVLEQERRILQSQASVSGKPADVVSKMVDGRLNKFYEEFCFLEQRFLLDDSQRVKDALARLSKSVGLQLRIPTFLRVQCGEGLEAAKADFAAEVAQMASQQ